MIDALQLSAKPAEPHRLFQGVDWFCLGLTSLLSFLVYLFTLAPDVTLEYSGIYCTDAMYPGPSIPPGHPVWAVYGWLFTKLIPFGNIAWRLNVASALAGALTCGMIALLVSRVGLMAVESIPDFRRFSRNEQQAFRIVCGVVAGLGFGLDGCFWPKAVVADTWPLSLCLLMLTLCLLTRWFFTPQRYRHIYAAAFLLGLTISESQALIPAAFGFPFLLLIGKRQLGREIFFGISFALWATLLLKNTWLRLGWLGATSSGHVLIGVAVIATLVWLFAVVQTRSFLSEWKASSACAVLFFAGFGANFLLPVFSMTTPPVNWAYPRTSEGFFHLMSRGQFGSLAPTSSFGELMMQLMVYAKISMDEFGVIYLMAAAIPFLLAHKISPPARKWMLGYRPAV